VYLDSLAAEAGGDKALQRELATAYEKMADVLGRPSAPNLGDVPGAVAAYRKAQAARERVLADEPDNADLLREMSTTSQKLAKAVDLTGDTRGGTEEARKAVVIEEHLAASDRSPAQVLRLARSYVNHGYLLHVGDETLASLDRLRKGAALLEGLNASGWNPAEVRPILATTYGYLASALWLGRPVAGVVPDLKAAFEMQSKAVALNASMAAAAASDTNLQRRIMVGNMNLGQIVEQMGDWPRAREHYREGLARAEQLAHADAANLQAQSDFGWTSYRLGTLLARDGATDEALALLNQSVRLFEPVIAADPTSKYTQAQVAGYEEGFGYAHAALASDRSRPREARQEHWREARARFQSAYAFWKGMRDEGIALGADAARPEALAAEIAKCDAALREPLT
jgi:tetratricopeptide (TPR) repeat protein